MPESRTPKPITPLQCPKCGGGLGRAGGDLLICEYCGTSFAAADILGGKRVDLGPFYQAAMTALDAGDYAGAYEYFSRILELEPRQSDAWVGKGVAGVFAGWQRTQDINAAEALTCFETARACYDGPDRTRFEQSLADRAGAAAAALLPLVVEAQATDKENLEALLALLRYGEKKGTQEEACWRTILAVAEQQVVPSHREAGTTYLTFQYPYKALAVEYAGKIRAKYDPNLVTDYERRAENWNDIKRDATRIGKILLIIAAVVVGAALLIVLLFIILGVYLYFSRGT